MKNFSSSMPGPEAALISANAFYPSKCFIRSGILINRKSFNSLSNFISLASLESRTNFAALAS